jgi:hypothetical protein
LELKGGRLAFNQFLVPTKIPKNVSKSRIEIFPNTAEDLTPSWQVEESQGSRMKVQNITVDLCEGVIHVRVTAIAAK